MVTTRLRLRDFRLSSVIPSEQKGESGREEASQPDPQKYGGRELPDHAPREAFSSLERRSPKAEPAARRWLVRYLSEGTPSLQDVATALGAQPREMTTDP